MLAPLPTPLSLLSSGPTSSPSALESFSSLLPRTTSYTSARRSSSSVASALSSSASRSTSSSARS
eukprot:5375750-Prymnesium_polylepis.1